MSEDIYLPVEKIESVQLIPNNKKWITRFLKPFNYCIRVKHPKDGEIIVNFCSVKYDLVSNSDIFPIIEKELKKKYKDIEISHEQIDYSKFYVQYIIKDIKYFIGEMKDEELNPCIKIFHSYSGLLKSQLIFGYHRKTCENSLFGIKYEKPLFIDVKGKRKKLVVNTVMNYIDKFINKDAYLLIDSYNQLYKNNITDVCNEIEIEKIYNNTGFPRSTKQTVIEEVEKELEKRIYMNDWILYNVFNQQLTHHDMKAHDEQKLKLDRKVYNYITLY